MNVGFIDNAINRDLLDLEMLYAILPEFHVNIKLPLVFSNCRGILVMFNELLHFQFHIAKNFTYLFYETK